MRQKARPLAPSLKPASNKAPALETWLSPWLLSHLSGAHCLSPSLGPPSRSRASLAPEPNPGTDWILQTPLYIASEEI